MRYNIKKNWVETIDFMRTTPRALLPFIIVAFVQALALEAIYFSTRYPISLAATPIIKKFFGVTFVHYPGNLLVLPRLFYYAQIAITIFFGIFMTAIAVNIFKNTKAGLPVKRSAVINNAAKKYFSFIIYAVIAIAFLFFVREAAIFILSKGMIILSKFITHPALPKIYPFVVMGALFLTNVALQVFFLLVVPIMVLEKKGLIKAFAKNIYIGARNFRTLFALLFSPFLLYFPVTMLKNFSDKIMKQTFPEINLYITLFDILVTIFLDCFLIICVSQFLLDKDKQAAETAK